MPRNLANSPDLDATEFLEAAKHSEWRSNLETVDEPLAWKCFYCRRETSSKGAGRRLIFTDRQNQNRHLAWLVVCSYCNMPTMLDSQNRPLFQAVNIPLVPNLPQEVNDVFLEALKALSVDCNSSAILLCRKLIMHLAFDLGKEHFEALTAKKNGRTPNFVEYVQWLDEHHHIPPSGRKWVDEVVSRGNDENHQLILASRDEAERIVKITRLLLSYSYEIVEVIGSSDSPV